MASDSTRLGEIAILPFVSPDSVSQGRNRPARYNGTAAPPAMNSPGLQLYAEEVRRLPAPGDAETRLMIARMRGGDSDTMRQMVVRHLSLVVDLVERHGLGRHDDALAALEAGNRALVQAAQDFDTTAAESFESFARRQVLAALSGGT